MKNKSNLHRSGGFSLAEVLVALFIMSLVSAAGASMLIGASQSAKQVRASDEVVKELQLAESLIRNDIEAITPRIFDLSSNFDSQNGFVWRATETDGSVMAFYRDGWLHAGLKEPRSDLQAVEYLVNDGKLLRRVHFKNSNVEYSREILQSVLSVRTRIHTGTRWISNSAEWEQTTALWPDAVELVIRFEDASEFRITSLSGARR